MVDVLLLEVHQLNAYVLSVRMWALRLGVAASFPGLLGCSKTGALVRAKSLCECLRGVLAVIIFARHCQVLLRELARGGKWFLLLELLDHHVRDLLLRAL